MIKRKKEIISLLLTSVMILSTGCTKKNNIVKPINIEFKNVIDKNIDYKDIKNIYLIELENNNMKDYYITKKIPSIITPTYYNDLNTNKEIVKYKGVPGKYSSNYGEYTSSINLENIIINELGIKDNYSLNDIENLSRNIINNYEETIKKLELNKE